MMQVSEESFSALAAPFPATDIQWRVGNTAAGGTLGQALPYIDARAVQKRLDQALGAYNWSVQFFPSPMSNGLVCRIGIRVGESWVYKEDGAQLDAASDEDQNASERAIKGAYSDALKRAAVMWGVGRYLYDFRAPFVPVERRGRQFVLTERPVLPPEFLPEADFESATAAYEAYREKLTQAAEARAAQSNTAQSGAGGKSAPTAPAQPDTQPSSKAVQASPEKSAAPAPAAAAKPTERQTAPASERNAQANASAPTQRSAPPAAAKLPEDAPTELTDYERGIVAGILPKIDNKEISVVMLEHYINGPRVTGALGAQALDYLKRKLEVRRELEATEATA